MMNVLLKAGAHHDMWHLTNTLPAEAMSRFDRDTLESFLKANIARGELHHNNDYLRVLSGLFCFDNPLFNLRTSAKNQLKVAEMVSDIVRKGRADPVLFPVESFPGALVRERVQEEQLKFLRDRDMRTSIRSRMFRMIEKAKVGRAEIMWHAFGTGTPLYSRPVSAAAEARPICAIDE